MQPHFGTTMHRCDVGPFSVSEITFPTAATLPEHAHDTAQLSMVLEGEMLEIGTVRGDVHGPTGAVYRPAGYPHHNLFVHETRGMVIQIRDTRFAPLFDDRARYPDLPEMAPIARRIHDELTSSDVASPVALEGALLDCVAAIARATRPMAYAEALAAAIERDPAKRWQSSAEVSAAFRSTYGCSIPTYVLGQRIAFAKRLLLQSRMPVAAIAAESGFFDQAHFTRAFVKATGSTPRRFRAGPTIFS